MLGPFHAAAESGALWTHESFAARALLPALRGRPPGYTVPYETRWTGDRSLFTPLLRAVLAGIITADGRSGNDLADAACKLVVLEHCAPPNIREARLTAISAVTRMAHWIARVGSARQRLDFDST